MMEEKNSKNFRDQKACLQEDQESFELKAFRN